MTSWAGDTDYRGGFARLCLRDRGGVGSAFDRGADILHKDQSRIVGDDAVLLKNPRIVGRGRARSLDIILAGRKVPAEECLGVGLCERLVPDGTCRESAEALAHAIARFPQECLRAGRRSVGLQEGLSEHAALRTEWECSAEVVACDGAAGRCALPKARAATAISRTSDPLRAPLNATRRPHSSFTAATVHSG